MTEHEPELNRIGPGKALDLLLGAERIVITTHMNPDGDALGSEGGLYFFLKKTGKQPRIINTGPVPPNMSLLGEDGIFEEYDPLEHTDAIANADLIAVLDVNVLSRIDRLEDPVGESGATKLVIDHHTKPKKFADYYWIDADKSSTGEMVYDLIAGSENGSIDKTMAKHLYVAIMTDTGSFRFERTTPHVHRITAELLETGLFPPDIHEGVYDDFELNRTRLLGMVLRDITPVCRGRATIMTITREMFNETGTGNDDTEGMVNFGLSIKGTKATAMLTELEDEIKISMRSRGGVEVADIARTFGGGGHPNAAAARIQGAHLAEVRRKVEAAFCSLFD